MVQFSGQVRLVRGSTDGGSGIHLVHGMSSSDSDEDEEDFAYHNGEAPSPPGMNKRYLLINGLLSFWNQTIILKRRLSQYYCNSSVTWSSNFALPSIKNSFMLLVGDEAGDHLSQHGKFAASWHLLVTLHPISGIEHL